VLLLLIIALISAPLLIKNGEGAGISAGDLAPLVARSTESTDETEEEDEPEGATIVVKVLLVIPQGNEPSKTKPCQAAEVVLEGTLFKATTNNKGIARFKDVPEGDYKVRASLADHATGTGEVSVKAGERKTVTITLQTKEGAGGTKEIHHALYLATEAKTSSLAPNMTGKQQEELFHLISSVNPESLERLNDFSVNAIPHWLAFDSTGKKLFAAVEGQKIYVLDVTKESEAVRAISTGDGFVSDMKTARGRNDVIFAALFSGSGAGIMLIGTENENLSDFISASGASAGARAVGVSDDGSLAVATFGDSGGSMGEVIGFDVATKEEMGRARVGGLPLGAAVSPDRQWVYVSSYSKDRVYMISTSDWKVRKEIAVGARPMRISLTPDGTKLFVANSGSNDVTVIEARSGTAMTTIAAGSQPMDVASSPDGRRIYVSNRLAGTVTLIDAGSNTAVKTVKPSEDINIRGLAVCPR
jgi:YVTN family beta-propeller protein